MSHLKKVNHQEIVFSILSGCRVRSFQFNPDSPSNRETSCPNVVHTARRKTGFMSMQLPEAQNTFWGAFEENSNYCHHHGHSCLENLVPITLKLLFIMKNTTDLVPNFIPRYLWNFRSQLKIKTTWMIWNRITQIS